MKLSRIKAQTRTRTLTHWTKSNVFGCGKNIREKLTQIETIQQTVDYVEFQVEMLRLSGSVLLSEMILCAIFEWCCWLVLLDFSLSFGSI